MQYGLRNTVNAYATGTGFGCKQMSDDVIVLSSSNFNMSVYVLECTLIQLQSADEARILVNGSYKRGVARKRGS